MQQFFYLFPNNSQAIITQVQELEDNVKGWSGHDMKSDSQANKQILQEGLTNSKEEDSFTAVLIDQWI